MDTVQEILDMVFWDNPLSTWLWALGTAAATLVALRVVMRLLIWRVKRLAERTEVYLDDLIINLLENTKGFFILVVSLYAGMAVLTLPENVREIAGTVTVITIFLQIAFWGNQLIDRLTERTTETRADAAAATTVNAMGLVGKVILWSVIVLLALDNIPGVEVNSLIASLGVGGVAVALAVQNLLGDVFANISIALDKPFVIGDFIIVDDYLGTVEDIGIKSTRVRSLYGEELIFSNSDLLNSRIQNYKSMARRRIQTSFGVLYETPFEKVQRIPQIVKEIIESIDDLTLDRAHFSEYGDYALVFEVVYYVEHPDYNLYMDRQQSFNLGLHERFEAEGIKFAYPTQKVFLQENNFPPGK